MPRHPTTTFSSRREAAPLPSLIMTAPALTDAAPTAPLLSRAASRCGECGSASLQMLPRRIIQSGRPLGHFGSQRGGAQQTSGTSQHHKLCVATIQHVRQYSPSVSLYLMAILRRWQARRSVMSERMVARRRGRVHHMKGGKKKCRVCANEVTSERMERKRTNLWARSGLEPPRAAAKKERRTRK